MNIFIVMAISFAMTTIIIWLALTLTLWLIERIFSM